MKTMPKLIIILILSILSISVIIGTIHQYKEEYKVIFWAIVILYLITLSSTEQK